MRDYRSMLKDHIQKNGLFESKDGSFESSKNNVIDYAIDYLLRPDWENARINHGIREESEVALVKTVVSAVSNTIFDFIGLDCEKEIQSRMDDRVNEWHKTYSI